VSAWSSAAAAQATSIHGTADVTVSYDDNILSAPDDPVAGQAEPISDISITLTPGALFVHRMQRGALILRYSRAFAFFIQNNDVSSTADVGAVLFNYALSDQDTLGLGLSIQRSSTNLVSLQAASSASAGAQPATPVQLLSPSLTQNYRHDFDERWSLGQDADTSWTFPLEDSATVGDQASAGFSAGPNYQIGDHTFGIEGGIRYNFLDRPSEADDTVDVLHQIIPSALGTWSWQFAERWQQQASAGVGVPINLSGGFGVAPLATLTTLYQDDLFGASLTLAQVITPNPLNRQIFLTDSATLNALLPILRDEGLLLEGATGIAYNRQIDADQTTSDTSVNTWTADAAIRYLPPTLPFSASVRYQHIRQFGATSGGTLSNLTRNVVSLTIGTILPPLDNQQPQRPGFLPSGPAVSADPQPGESGEAP
jgi:hypothetical protein